MRDYGFVAQYGTPPSTFSTKWNQLSADWNVVQLPRFRLAANPFRTTLENSDEYQPIDRPTYTLAYQGYCYNRSEIAERIGKLDLKEASDGEIFAAAYEKWDTKFGEYVHGEFSIVVYDKKKDSIVAKRSAVSGPPLFYGFIKGSLYISSELSTLLEVIGENVPFDEKYIAKFLVDVGLTSTTRTPYKGIKRLLSGRKLIFREQTSQITRYYDIRNTKELFYRNNIEYEEHFLSILQEAVTQSLRSNREILLDLSGGLDSSTIVCVAGELVKKGIVSDSNIATITYAHTQSPLSEETEYWKSVLEVVPFNSHVYDIDAMPAYTSLPKTACWEPNLQLSHPAFEHLLAEWMPQKKVKTVIKGIGGDEILSGLYGFPLHLSDYLRKQEFTRWVLQLRDWYFNNNNFNLGSLMWTYSIRPLIYSNNIFLKFQQVVPDWFIDSYANNSLKPNLSCVGDNLSTSIKSVPSRIHYAMMQRIETVKFHEAAKVEERLPLAFRPLVEFMYSIPWEQKINAQFDRLIQRRSMKNILPEKVRTRRSKAGIEQSILQGLKQGWPIIQDLIKTPEIAKRGYVNPVKFRESVEKLHHGIICDDRPFVVAALNLEIWLKTHPWYGGSNLRQ